MLPGKSDTAGGGGIEGLLIGETARELTLQDTIAVSRLARVRQVTPVVVGAGTVSTRARVRDITVVGTSEPMASIQHWTIGLGRFLPPGALDVASPVCVLGYTVAHELYDEETRSARGSGSATRAAAWSACSPSSGLRAASRSTRP